jgi:hypothetical protein
MLIAIVLACGATLVARMTAAAPNGQPLAFHVARDGQATNPGTADKPFATLAQARQAIRDWKAAHGGRLPPGGITVWLHEGRHELEEPFVLEPEDSGSDGAPIAYRAMPAKAVVVSGGRILRGWRRLTEPVPGLPSAARGKVWSVDLPAGWDGHSTFRQLWKNGARLPRARWPNQDAEPETAPFRVTDASLPDKKTRTDPIAVAAWRRELPARWQTIEFDAAGLPNDGRLPTDLATGDAELFCINDGRWATMRIPIGEAEDNRLRLKQPAGVLSHYWGGMRLMTAVEGTGFIENALSLLDQPSEWYLDRRVGRVYYLPAEGEDPSAVEIVAPRLEQLLCLRGTPAAPVHHVEIRGIAFAHAEWPLPEVGYRPGLGCWHGTEHTPLVSNPPEPPGSIRRHDEFPEESIPAAIDLTYAEHCRLEGCRVSHVGASGIGLGEGCRHNSVVGCRVFDAGGHGIHVGMPHGPVCAEDFAWQRPEDEPLANEVLHCHVHHTGRMDWGAYGIFNSYAHRTRIAHNLVEQQPYCGMAVCFSWFCFPTGREPFVTVEHNHIHHVMLKLFDGGAIYTKDGVAPGSTIRGNLIHDVGHGDWMCNGLFLDDGSYGFEIADNVISHVRTPIRFNNTTPQKFSWGVNYCGARDETITFVGNGGGAIVLDPQPLPVADAPDALKRQAGPAAPLLTSP